MTSQQIQQHFIYNIGILQTFINVFSSGESIEIKLSIIVTVPIFIFPTSHVCASENSIDYRLHYHAIKRSHIKT